MDQLGGVLSFIPYVRYKEGKYIDNVIEFATTIDEDKIVTYNVTTFAVAALFYVTYRNSGGLKKKNVDTFIREFDGLKEVNHLDLIRYLREIFD